MFVGPALREMDVPAGAAGSPLAAGGAVSDLAVERWRNAYLAMVDDAVRIGIPR